MAQVIGLIYAPVSSHTAVPVEVATTEAKPIVEDSVDVLDYVE